MTRTEQWLALVGALQALSSLQRPLRICFDYFFADDSDFDTLHVLFPFVEKIGLIVPNHDAAASYRHLLRSKGWNKVVCVIQGWDSTDSYDLIVTRWC